MLTTFVFFACMIVSIRVIQTWINDIIELQMYDSERQLKHSMAYTACTKFVCCLLWSWLFYLLH